MRKIVSVVYDDFLADPRAKKFYEALNGTYDIRIVSLSIVDGERINNIALKCEAKNRFVRLFKFWVFVLKQVKAEKPDAILGHNFYTGLLCYIAARINRAHLLYDAYEFYFPRKHNFFSKRDWFFFLQEKIAIKNATVVFAANEERARLMKVAYSLNDMPVPVLNVPIYCEYKGGIRKSDKDNGGKLMLVYEGYISFTRFLDMLVNSLEFLPNRFELTIIGDGADSELLVNLIASKPFKDRIHYLGRILNKDILPTLSKCDIGFVGYPFGDLNNIYCSPNKIYEYPASGIPFISTKQHPIWSVTERYHICEFYDPLANGAQNIADAFLRIADNYDYYTQNISLFNKENSWEKERAKIINVVKANRI